MVLSIPNLFAPPMTDQLKAKLKDLPTKPGIYRMYDADGKILYVGKAKHLKKRLSSYFRSQLDSVKTTALMAKVVNFDYTITDSENQALLLESNLIKKHRPRYNVLLRDDKAYPYLFLSTKHPFPRLDYSRGKKKEKGRYFGPYPNAGAVRENLALIQKLFKLRQCRDVFFRHRTRPCLQYQIDRCTAPCVGKVSKEDYKSQVNDAIAFLEGKNTAIVDAITERMEVASEAMKYEVAAQQRDLLIKLRQLTRQQSVTGGEGNVDVFGVAGQGGVIAVTVVVIRGGQLIGHQTYFPNLPAETTLQEALTAFLPQYYLNPEREKQLIDKVVLSHAIDDRVWLQGALSELMQKKIQISERKTVVNREWLSIALSNAQEAVQRKQSEMNTHLLQLEALQTALDLPIFPRRIECFDISHTSGKATKASCVVFDVDGLNRRAYRQFDIKDITEGDDYAAMKQVLTRRYTRLKSNESALPDLIIVDGGKGQLKQAEEVLEELQVSGVILMGVAKGPARKAGLETLLLAGHDKAIRLPPEHQALHLIQIIRDEAHRFAITAHRKKRTKQGLQSKLTLIPGVGNKRRQQLLTYFGGFLELKNASQAEIAKVPGISENMAAKIYSVLHEV